MFSLYKKELHSFFYTPFAYTITALFMLLFSFSINNAITYLNSSTLQFSFPDIFYTNIFYFIFLVPLMTMRTFADERKFGTEVLLMTSPMNVFQMVLAKFLALVTVYLVMMASTLLYPIVTAINGKVIIPSLIGVYVGFFLWGIMCIAVGMFISSLTDNSIIAGILGEAVMLALVYVDNFAQSDFISQYPKVQNFIIWFAAQPKFAYFAQGLVRMSDVVFFISMMVIFLGWTIISIEKKRWNRG